MANPPNMDDPPSSGPWPALYDAGRALVAEGGLRGLSVRAIVAASGWTMGEFGYRIGKKEQLIAAIAAAEQAAHDAFDAAWLDRLAAVPAFASDIAAKTIAGYLDDRAANHPAAVIFWEELLLEAAVDATLRPLVLPWIEARERFWRDLFHGRHPKADAIARLAMKIAVEEQPYTVALGAKPVYRLLRDISLHRLCNGLLRSGDDADGMLFDSLLDDLVPGGPPQATVQGRALPFAHAIARLMLEHGVGAITHRAVATAMGTSPSAVAHHFPTHMDLIRGGNEALHKSFYAAVDIKGIRQSAEPDPIVRGSLVDPQLSAVGLVRATHMIALAGARSPDLVPLTVRRRRDRGHTSSLWMGDLFASPDRFDRCAGQLTSMILGGELFLSLAAGIPYRGTSPQALTDLIDIAS